MSLPSLAELPAILLPLVTRAEQSFRAAVEALEDDHGLSAWPPERWAQFARVSAASDFVIEQSVRDPSMLLELVRSGELDRNFASGELCAQIAAAVNQAALTADFKQEMERLLIVGAARSPAQTRELMLQAEAQYVQYVRETGASID